MYFRVSLVQFTSLCACLWRLKLSFIQVHRMGRAASHQHCWQCTACSHSSHSSIIKACALPCPKLPWDIKPYCHLQRCSFYSGYTSSCCRAFPFPLTFTDTNTAANLSYCPLPPIRYSPSVRILELRGHILLFITLPPTQFLRAFSSTVLDKISHCNLIVLLWQ